MSKLGKFLEMLGPPQQPERHNNKPTKQKQVKQIKQSEPGAYKPTQFGRKKLRPTDELKITYYTDESEYDDPNYPQVVRGHTLGRNDIKAILNDPNTAPDELLERFYDVTADRNGKLHAKLSDSAKALKNQIEIEDEAASVHTKIRHFGRWLLGGGKG